MKKWIRAKILKKDKNIDFISRAYINYIFSNGPMEELIRKYHMDDSDIVKLNQDTANRIAGLLTLYFAKDQKRLNEIILKYSTTELLVGTITPEIEGYIEIN